MQNRRTNEQMWRDFFYGKIPHERFMRHFYRLVPAEPRCRQCNAPFKGLGGSIVRSVTGARPSKRNPNFCSLCDDFAHKHPGGTEVEMGFLFADIRGSTQLAENMAPHEFSTLINRFYAAANGVLVKADAWIDKMIGDEVVAFFIPGFAGKDFAAKAIEAGRNLLDATGHNDPAGPWVPVGVGINVGVAYMGTIGSEETVTDVTALGDEVNITARLASTARAGEILITTGAVNASKLDTKGLEHRDLELKGKSMKIPVVVMNGTRKA